MKKIYKYFFFCILAFLGAVSLCSDSSARSWMDSGEAYFRLAIFKKGIGDIEREMRNLLDSPNYLNKCIENSEIYSSDLAAARRGFRLLSPQVTKFYEARSTDLEIEQLNADLLEVGQVIENLLANNDQNPPVFRISDACSTPTESHVENARSLFWLPVLNSMKNVHILVSQDLNSAN